MKRGRPSKRTDIQSNIMDVLTASSGPLTISYMRKLLSQRLQTQISWNTVQKYLDELVQVEKIQAIPLPHSKDENKTGLTVYTLKK